ncbi:MAG TPA: hypothetical protein PLX89_23620 [Verrucomicrobiota bacterium]|nr:hypothetical protein [Verrucomicrobiota bacterium]
MKWPFFRFRKRPSPFGTGESVPVPLAITRQQEIKLAPTGDGLNATIQSPGPVVRQRPSWFGWLWGRNRRRDASDRWVQGELLLQQVRPVRNDFRELSTASEPRRGSKVLYETPLTPERRDDQDHAWNRLRNRQPDSLHVSGD